VSGEGRARKGGGKQWRYRTPDLLRWRACSQAKARRQQNGAGRVPRRGASSGYARLRVRQTYAAADAERAEGPRGTCEAGPVLRLGPDRQSCRVAGASGRNAPARLDKAEYDGGGLRIACPRR